MTMMKFSAKSIVADHLRLHKKRIIDWLPRCWKCGHSVVAEDTAIILGGASRLFCSEKCTEGISE